MEYRRLGDTDLDVSTLCLGTMTWGEQNTEPEAHAQLDQAVSGGINFIDTAEIYPVPPIGETQGRTEQYIGSWLHARGGRNRLILATKVSGPGDWMTHLRGGPKLVRAHIETALEDSLRRLQTDYVDLYQVHWPARNTNFFGKLGFAPGPERDATAIEETLYALDRLVQSGKVRHLGISNETPWGTMRYLCLARERGWPRIVSIQNPYNLLNRSYEVGMAEMSYREQVGLLAYSPLAFGVLSGKYLDGQRPAGARLTLFERFDRYNAGPAQEAIQRYVNLAREHGLSPAQMALAYVNSRPFLTSTIIGATTLEQLEEDMGSMAVQLDEDVMKGIEAIHQAIPNPSP